MGKFISFIKLVFIFLFLFIITYLFWYFYKNTISFLDKGKISEKILEKTSYLEKDKKSTRHFQDIILNCDKAKTARFTLSLPKEINNKKLSCIIILSGIETGRKNLDYLPDHSGYALVGYEYPTPIKNKNNIFDFREALFTVPSQILSISSFIKKQDWSNQKISIAGFSFGSIFVPAIYHLSIIKKIPLNIGIIAYGGAGLYDLLYANLPDYYGLLPIEAFITSILFRPIDPSFHLPYMKNTFLIINGLSDKKIPLKCAKKLQELTPQPKTIINLPTEHISPNNTELIHKIFKICKKWLNKNDL